MTNHIPCEVQKLKLFGKAVLPLAACHLLTLAETRQIGSYFEGDRSFLDVSNGTEVGKTAAGVTGVTATPKVSLHNKYTEVKRKLSTKPVSTTLSTYRKSLKSLANCFKSLQTSLSCTQLQAFRQSLESFTLSRAPRSLLKSLTAINFNFLSKKGTDFFASITSQICESLNIFELQILCRFSMFLQFLLRMPTQPTQPTQPRAAELTHFLSTLRHRGALHISGLCSTAYHCGVRVQFRAVPHA
jgi:hypothetical protein